MVITRTPFRMSFFGGGTDFPMYYREHGGAVLSSTFDKYCYVNIRHLPPFFDYSTEIVYSRIERVTDIYNLTHPLVRNAMAMLDMHELRLSYEGDLPARTGLGTSSSFAVGMLNAFYAIKGKTKSKRNLADDAIRLERVLCAEAGGVQDQIAAAFGGFNRIDFCDEGYTVTPIIMQNGTKRELNDNLIMFFTGFSRFSSDIQVSTEKSLAEKTAELKELHALVYEAENALHRKDFDEFGKLLDYTWRLKRGISSGISTTAIDSIYEIALKNGATGGKLLGAGGGGFLLFYCEKERQRALIDALNGLLYIPFKFETTGTQVIYYEAEDYDYETRLFRKDIQFENAVSGFG
jgi:D-glycero-alpha-D-manno-heptose-7-phosphate kinase